MRAVEAARIYPQQSVTSSSLAMRAKVAPKKYVRFSQLTGRVIGTAGLTESGVKYRVQFPANGSTRSAKCIVVHGKYLRPVLQFKDEVVHAAPCRFPYERCTCGVGSQTA